MSNTLKNVMRIFILAALAIFQGQLAAAQEITYAADVAPILWENCAKCHSPGNVAPMSLLSFEDARPYAAMIKEKVQSRQMPPWDMVRSVGIQAFKNDPSLSDREIETIVQWVDAGAPLGDPSDLGVAPQLLAAGGEWKLEEDFGRPPDLIFWSPPYSVLPNGRDQWVILQGQVEGLDEPRWAQAIETRPKRVENRYVFHHFNTSINTSAGRSLLMHANVGKDFDFYPEDTGRLIEPGSELSFDMHFFALPGQTAEDAQAEFAIWFHPVGYEPPLAGSREQLFYGDPNTSNAMWRPGNPCWQQPAVIGPECTEHMPIRGNDILIPPNGYSTIQGFHVLDRALRIHSIQIHMHQRGMRQTLQAIYPDGRSEIINVLNFNHRWLTTYVYEDQARPLFPKGTVLVVTSQHDNTTANETNPDPSQWVFFGDRSIDEMSHMWIGTTWLDDDQYEAMVKEREGQQQIAAGDGG